MRKGMVSTLAVVAVLTATAALAQDVKLKAPEPTREPRVIAPGLLYETRPNEENVYPGYPPSVPHDPAFIRPFSTDVETPQSTGRLGLSGWTSPNPPVGPPVVGTRENNGSPSFGFSWKWGGPPPRSGRAGVADDAPAALPR